MSITNMQTTCTLLTDAAASAHDALGVSRQMLRMLREYTQLELQHATRLQALARRMGDCVDRMRLADNQRDGENESEADGDELRERQSRCVAVMDEVVTFLTRFGSMHRHLSDCLAGDLFDEWDEALNTQNERVQVQEPEIGEVEKQVELAEKEYLTAHEEFRTGFEEACTEWSCAQKGASDKQASLQHDVEEALRSPVTVEHRARSPSKALQIMGSLSRLINPSTGDSQRRKSATESSCQSRVEKVAFMLSRAEALRKECRDAYTTMQRLHTRLSRLRISLHQEYQCVQSECLASTRTSIRKLVIHLSAFTSNLQYDATQLFQQVEALHASDIASAQPQTLPQDANKVALLPSRERSLPTPPLDQPISVENLAERQLPVIEARPRLLRHQNARLALPISGRP